MVKTSWYDIEMRGRRLEKILKICNTMFDKYMLTEPDMALAYLDRMAKIEHLTQPYVEQMTGLKKLLQRGEKSVTNTISQ